jgi:uncharacterized protein YajQ (UPF0234 family)
VNCEYGNNSTPGPSVLGWNADIHALSGPVRSEQGTILKGHPPALGESMAGESTFDVVSKVDKQEVANALHQAQKELVQRYDFKGVGAEVDFKDEKILMKANSEERVLAVLDVLQSKLIRRGISLKSLDTGEPYPSGKEFRLEASIKEGIEQDLAKKINKLIRDEGPKGVKSQIQGDELRVSSKSRDDLQATMNLLKDFDEADLQFVNFRS